jgi:hypothetical protein
MACFLSIAGWVLISVTLHTIDGDDIDNAGLPEDRSLRRKFYVTFVLVSACASVAWLIIIGVGQQNDFFS